MNSGPPPSKGESFSRGQRDGGRGGYGGRGVKSFDNTNKVYVGNLAWSVDNLALETLFQDQGNVMEARVVYDRDTGRSKGFGFVTYGSMDEVNKAVDSLDGLVSIFCTNSHLCGFFLKCFLESSYDMLCRMLMVDVSELVLLKCDRSLNSKQFLIFLVQVL